MNISENKFKQIAPTLEAIKAAGKLTPETLRILSRANISVYSRLTCLLDCKVYEVLERTNRGEIKAADILNIFAIDRPPIKEGSTVRILPFFAAIQHRGKYYEVLEANDQTALIRQRDGSEQMHIALEHLVIID